MFLQIERETGPRVLKIGGSVYFKERSADINQDFIQDFIKTLIKQRQEDSQIVVVVGGGELARRRKLEAQKGGVTNSKRLDEIGIGVSINNARVFAAIAEARGLSVTLGSNWLGRYAKDKIVFQGGTKSGQTTDAVAIWAARAVQPRNNRVVHMISNIPGLLEEEKGKLTNRVIPEIHLTEYAKTIPGYESGMHTPLDPVATAMALQHNVKVVLMGPDMVNLENCLSGRQFIGTIFHPR